MKAYKLLQDIVIPAGTVFSAAPTKTERSEGHYQFDVGLSKDTSGSIIYYIGNPGEAEYEQTKEFFEEIDA